MCAGDTDTSYLSVDYAVSHVHLENLEGYDHVHKTLHLPPAPTVERDVYCTEIMVQVGKSTALVCVHRGTCYVNGEEMREGEKPRRMKNGTTHAQRYLCEAYACMQSCFNFSVCISVSECLV